MTEPHIIRKQLKLAVEELIENGNPKPLDDLFEAEADGQGRLFVGEYDEVEQDLDGFFGSSNSPTMYQ